MSSLSFSPPRSPPLPSRRPLQPPARLRGRARVLGSGPGIGIGIGIGTRTGIGIGRMEAESEEAEGKGGEASGAPCRGAASSTLTVWRGTRQAERAGAQARTRVRVCECGSEARRGEERRGEERRGEERSLPSASPRADRGRAQSQGERDRLRSFIILDSFAPPLVKMTGSGYHGIFPQAAFPVPVSHHVHVSNLAHDPTLKDATFTTVIVERPLKISYFL
ncbi:uncharacterized protein [Saccopteryx bilineata]|uniref:uncharacterized protein n=1 Tax=Saccopteryx bilineata TaxID=59482 RepID=UPI00338FD6AD